MKRTAYLSVGLTALVLAGFNLHARGTPELASAAFGVTPIEVMPPTEAMPVPATASDLPARVSPAPRRAPLVALQAGHWRAGEAPDELSGLRRNGGTRGGGKYEWEVNLEIAELAGLLLEEAGYEVDILPATVPPGYRADAFVAIHADGNNDPSVRGYRVGSPRRDATRRASELAAALSDAYGAATGIRLLPVATRRMRGYYAFRYNRYRHAIHPLTVGVIIETGFLTSPADREILLNAPTRAAQGIFEGVTRFLGPPIAAE